MDRPAFSICIPNFNYAHYIGQTIQSVLDQTYSDYEIVIVDNASTDRSVDVISSFASDRIRLYQNEYNVGFAPNLDRAAQQAHNPYIIMLSSDDLMRPTALETYAGIIEKLGEAAEHALIVSTVDVIDSQGRAIERRDRQHYYRINPDLNVAALSDCSTVETFSGLAVFREVFPRMTVPGHFCATLYSRRLYNRVGGYSSLHHIGPDAHLAYKALLQDAMVVFVNTPLFAYRIHALNQLGQDRSRLTIKVPLDRYLFTLQYSDAELSRAGVPRAAMVNFLIDDSCLKGGLAELRADSTYQAFRFLMFSFATYPSVALRNWKTYLLAALLLCGPTGPVLTRLLYRLYKNRTLIANEATMPAENSL